MQGQQKRRAEELIARAEAELSEKEPDSESKRGPWATEYIGRELEFIRDHMGEAHPRSVAMGKPRLRWWKGQQAMARAIFEHDLTMLVGSRGVGKSHLLRSVIGAYFLTRPSRVIVTATGERQVKDGLMAGARVAIGRSDFADKVKSGTMKIEIDPMHYIIGFSAKNPQAAAGFHADPEVPLDPDADELSEEDIAWLESEAGSSAASSLLLVIDEASGIDPRVYSILRGMKNKASVKIVLALNATLNLDDSHPVLDALRDESGFHRIKVASFSEDDFPDESGVRWDEVYDKPPAYLVSPEEKERARNLLEPNDREFEINWLAKFGTGSSNSLVIPRSALVKGRDLYTLQPDNLAIGPRVGIDLAYGGADACVAVLMLHGQVLACHEWRVSDDSPQAQIEIKDTIIELCIGWGKQVGQMPGSQWDGSPLYGARRLSIDVSGSSGVADILSAANVDCDRVNFGSGPSGDWPQLAKDMRFQNKRCEMAWIARRGLQAGYFQIPHLPEFARLWDQCQWTQFELVLTGGQYLVKLEPKEKVKERHNGQSPDYFDAFVLACRSGQHGPVAATLGAGGVTRLDAPGALEPKHELRVGPDSPAARLRPKRHKPGAGWR